MRYMRICLTPQQELLIMIIIIRKSQVIYLVELNNTSYYSIGICIHIQYCTATFDLNILYISLPLIYHEKVKVYQILNYKPCSPRGEFHKICTWPGAWLSQDKAMRLMKECEEWELYKKTYKWNPCKAVTKKPKIKKVKKS